MTKTRPSPCARDASLRTAILRRRAALLCVLAAASVIATTRPALAADAPGIPPGQDALMATMFGAGASLPGGCRFQSGQAVKSLIRVVYSCRSGPVVIDLAHRSTAPGPTLQTANFALELRSGNPPAGFAQALATLIRAGEAAFAWSFPDDAE